MRRTNSFSSEVLFSNSNDTNREKMFLSMKETLHRPLEKIKSKELLNYFYIYKNQNQDIPNNQEISAQENPFLLINSENKEEINNNSLIDINNDNNNNNHFIEKEKEENNIKYKNNRKNNNINIYRNKESNNSDIIKSLIIQI